MKKRLIDILAAGTIAVPSASSSIREAAPRAVTAASGDSNYTSVVASTDVASPVVYDLYDSATGYGISTPHLPARRSKPVPARSTLARASRRATARSLRPERDPILRDQLRSRVGRGAHHDHHARWRRHHR